VGNKPVYYPICLNVQAERCLVVGGGDVAARKVASLVEAGAAVVVVAPDVCDALAGREDATVVRRPWQESDLDGALLVIVATDDRSLNERVARAARKRGVLCNVVDDAGLSDFIVPASMRRGALLVSVSTSGALPALARSVREELEERFGPDYAGYLEIVGRIREDIVGSVSDENARREIFGRFADAGFIESVRGLEKDDLRRELEKVVREVARKYEDG
jgi:precorrin-2 dehydrogenase/sirohydrochlorin ferrochelatase